MPTREKRIEKASWVGIICNGLLGTIKIVTGWLTGSLAVIGDGIDSLSDIIASIITLVTSRILSKPPNVKFAYGYSKADSIATKALSFIIFFAGIQLAISSIKKIILFEQSELPSLAAIVVTIISIVGKILLSWQQTTVGKKTDSLMLIANGKNMQNDIIISTAVLTGLILTQVLNFPVLDSIFALLVSLWILKVAYGIFMKTNIDLMDGVDDCTIYNKIFSIIDEIEGVYNPHRVRARNIGPKLLINIDLEVNGDISLKQAHALAHKVERKIKENISNVFDVIIHVEPLGDEIKEKNLGLRRDQIND